MLGLVIIGPVGHLQQLALWHLQLLNQCQIPPGNELHTAVKKLSSSFTSGVFSGQLVLSAVQVDVLGTATFGLVVGSSLSPFSAVVTRVMVITVVEELNTEPPVLQMFGSCETCFSMLTLLFVGLVCHFCVHQFLEDGFMYHICYWKVHCQSVGHLTYYGVNIVSTLCLSNKLMTIFVILFYFTISPTNILSGSSIMWPYFIKVTAYTMERHHIIISCQDHSPSKLVTSF